MFRFFSMKVYIGMNHSMSILLKMTVETRIHWYIFDIKQKVSDWRKSEELSFLRKFEEKLLRILFLKQYLILSTLAKLYIPSTLNIDLILWHTHLIVCAENVKSWFKSWVFPFTFKAYILPHTLNCMCVSLFWFLIWILEQF